LKRKQLYSDVVKEVHAPSINLNKRLEIVNRINKVKNSRLNSDLSRSVDIGKQDPTDWRHPPESFRPHKFKPNPMKPATPKRPAPEIRDYLNEFHARRKTNHSLKTLDWK
jgi:hypothetical protein